MKQTQLIILVFSLLPSIAICQGSEPDKFRLFFLGGQSNMDGFGKTAELPDSLKNGYDDVWIFHGNPVPDEAPDGGLGKWDILQPGHGVGFASDGADNNLTDRFGIELSFAKRLKELYPNDKIALIKYSRFGTSIDSMAAGEFGSWEMNYTGENGINQFDHFLTTVHEALQVRDIDKDGIEDQLVPSGIIWMQGESDANYTEEIAMQYYSNLKRLMDLIRASLHKDDLPVVIGKISDSWQDKDGKTWDYGELVQYAQEKYVKEDKHAQIVRSTRYYKYSDPWHFDSEGYIDLGEKFAEAIFELQDENPL